MREPTTMQEGLNMLLPEIDRLRKEHERFKSWDGMLYNGGTVIVLACTTGATFAPATADPNSWWPWVPRILSGFASFWVALDRAKSYGARWRFHIERSNQLSVLKSRITVFSALPGEDKPARFKELLDRFDALLAGESSIPGTGAQSTEPPKKT